MMMMMMMTLYEKVHFLPFFSKNCKIQQCLMVFSFPNFRKMGEFVVSIEHSEAKSVSASGGLCPPDPRPGALPLDPTWGSAPRPPL